MVLDEWACKAVTRFMQLWCCEFRGSHAGGCCWTQVTREQRKQHGEWSNLIGFDKDLKVGKNCCSILKVRSTYSACVDSITKSPGTAWRRQSGKLLVQLKNVRISTAGIKRTVAVRTILRYWRSPMITAVWSGRCSQQIPVRSALLKWAEVPCVCYTLYSLLVLCRARWRFESLRGRVGRQRFLRGLRESLCLLLKLFLVFWTAKLRNT